MAVMLSVCSAFRSARLPPSADNPKNHTHIEHADDEGFRGLYIGRLTTARLFSTSSVGALKSRFRSLSWAFLPKRLSTLADRRWKSHFLTPIPTPACGPPSREGMKDIKKPGAKAGLMIRHRTQWSSQWIKTHLPFEFTTLACQHAWYS